MPLPSDRYDPESLQPSVYRGVIRIKTSPPGQQRYRLTDIHGEWMGEVSLRADIVCPGAEDLIRRLHEVCDPDEEEPPQTYLQLA